MIPARCSRPGTISRRPRTISARANALRHYVLGGEGAGLCPHPKFRPDAVLRMFKATRSRGPLRSYVEVIGHAQAARAVRRRPGPAEPGIVPPAPACSPRPPGAATLTGAEILSALRLAEADAAYHKHKLAELRDFPAVTADFAMAVASASGAGPERLVEAAGLTPLSEPEPPPGMPDDGILARYGAHLVEAAGLFRLEPEPGRHGRGRAADLGPAAGLPHARSTCSSGPYFPSCARPTRTGSCASSTTVRRSPASWRRWPALPGTAG